MIMLDTNICVYILKKHPPKVLEKFREIRDIHISSIVYSELQYGIELSPSKLKQSRQEQLINFLSLLIIDSWDEKAAQEYATLRAYLKAKGQLIGNMDMLIASHALSKKATLVTNNIKEFERIPNLKIENWAL